MFAFVTKWWRPFQYFNCVVSISLSFLVLWLPESPRFYHSNKLFNDARRIFTKIGRVNKKLTVDQEYEGKFEDEMTSDA